MTAPSQEGTPVKHTLTKTQKAVLSLALVPMIAVGIMGGYGTYSNISGAYGSGTAIGALAAGEGATAVLALLLLGLTLLGQSSPLVIRIGLWALPATAAVMGATAATEGTGQTLVYAATPLAITASAEGLAFLVRRIVVATAGRDIEAEARAAAVIRDLAYHQARAAAHPSARVQKRSVRRSWRLARKVGHGDVALGTQLLDVQRTRLVAGADVALERMFTPGMTSAPLELLAASAPVPPAIPAASAGDVMTPRLYDATIPADTHGRPTDTASDQAEKAESVRPGLQIVRPEPEKKPSIRADVRQMVADGVKDVRHIVDAIATRHDRKADDPRLKSTVNKYVREAHADTDATTDTEPPYTGHYA
jgi:hypothetical protein